LKNDAGWIRTILLSIIGAAIISSACSKPQDAPRQEEVAVEPPSVVPEEEQPAEPNLSPPKPAEAIEALSRIYQNTVIIDRNQKLITGDFNGDHSQDIAVVVLPEEGALSDINDELANWTLGDPTKVVVMKKTGVPATPEPVKVEKGDTLLAVIHGHGPPGWRNQEARQSYLLRNAAGSLMKTQKAEDAMKAHRGKLDFPRLRGDVITHGGRRGFLYWTGAKYAWYQPGEAMAQNSK
jgi:hypothetical protein